MALWLPVPVKSALLNAETWGVWISSHAREPAKLSRHNSNPIIETPLSEGGDVPEKKERVSLKRPKSRPFNCGISHKCLQSFRVGGCQNKVNRKPCLAQGPPLEEGEGLRFLEPALRLSFWWKRGAYYCTMEKQPSLSIRVVIFTSPVPSTHHQLSTFSAPGLTERPCK